MGVNLVIDSGNHSTKYYLFQGDKIVRMQSGAGKNLEDMNTFLQQHPFDAAILSSVVEPDHRLIEALEDAGVFVHFTPSTPTPLRMRYDSLETLGPDRIAAALAGWQRSDGSNVLVIVAGTCITYNIVESDGSFAGGAISPGLHMRLQAMHSFTGRLPLVSLRGDYPLTAISTETSLRSGALNGAVAEVKGMIAAYSEHFPSLKIMISGGDARFLAEALKNGIFARPELVAEGLNTILNYNVSNRLTR